MPRPPARSGSCWPRPAASCPRAPSPGRWPCCRRAAPGRSRRDSPARRRPRRRRIGLSFDSLLVDSSRDPSGSRAESSHIRTLPACPWRRRLELVRLQPQLLEPPVHGAAREPERLRRRLYAAAIAPDRAPDQRALGVLEAHFLERRRPGFRRGEPEVRHADLVTGREQEAALDDAVELADVARPGVVLQCGQRQRVETPDRAPVLRRLAPELRVREFEDLLAPLPE